MSALDPGQPDIPRSREEDARPEGDGSRSEGNGLSPERGRTSAEELRERLLSGCFFTLDAGGAVSLWSRRAEDELGVQRAEASGKTLAEALGIAAGERIDAFTEESDGPRVTEIGRAGPRGLRVCVALIPIRLANGYRMSLLLQDVGKQRGSVDERERLRRRHADTLGLVETALRDGSVGDADGEGARVVGSLAVFEVLGESPETAAEPEAGDDDVTEARLRELTAQVEELTAAIESERAAAAEAGAHAEAAAADLETARADAEAARGGAETARADAEAARGEAEMARADAAAARGEVESARAEAADLRTRLEAAEARAAGEHSRADEELHAAQERVRAAEAEAETLRAQLTEATTAVEAAGDEAESARGEAESARAERDEAVAGRVAAVTERDALAAERDEAVAGGHAAVTERDALAAERDAIVAERDGAVSQRDAAVADRDAAFAERDSVAVERDALMVGRDGLVGERDAAVEERDALVVKCDALAGERDAAIGARDAAVGECDVAIRERDAALVERDAMAAAGEAVAAERDAAIAGRDAALAGSADAEANGAELAATRVELDRARSDLASAQAELDRLQAELATAREDAARANDGSRIAHDEQVRAGQEAEAARQEAETARQEAKMAKEALDAAREEAEAAREEVRAARAELESARAEVHGVREEASETRARLETVESSAEEARIAADDVAGELDELRRQAERFRGAFESSPVGTALAEPGGRFLHVNRALCDALGYSVDRLLETGPDQIVHPDERDAEREVARRLVAGEPVEPRTERRYLHADGHAVPMLETVSLVTDARGDPLMLAFQLEPFAAASDQAIDPASAGALPAIVAEAEVEAERLPLLLDDEDLSITDPLAEDPATTVVPTSAIHQALAGDGFVHFCQPISDLRTEEHAQYELLLRLPEPGGNSLLLPEAFMGAAREAGMRSAIDRWVVGKAIRLIDENARAGRHPRIEINVAAESITDPELPALVERELAAIRIDPSQLILSVNETAAVATIEPVTELATRLRSLGCRFAIQHFGSSFGSFRHLKDAPVDYLKLDPDLTVTLRESRPAQLVVKAIVEVANGGGMETVAGFVSDDETLAVLRRLGVRYAQGYRVGRPRPVTEVWPPLAVPR
jgi:PAS domain S-box-containing protein